MLKRKRKQKEQQDRSGYSKDLDGKPIDNNKFMKILIACGVTQEQMKDYTWFVTEMDKKHKYECAGFHPVAKRINIIKENIIV